MLDEGTISPMPQSGIRRPPSNSGRQNQAPNVGDTQLHVRVARVAGKIALTATDQVVDDPHGKSALNQEVDHMAADEAGATGDDCNRLPDHFTPRFFIVRTL
jgi:hypothetical protein